MADPAGQAACAIVIPVHDHASVTRQCLAALWRTVGAVPVEVIVVDDGSTDTTAAVLAEAGDRIRVVRRAENGGFAAACNDGARLATAPHLVFLNNDTLPRVGWLDALERYAAAHPAAAVIGSKLLNRDGTIQHAGVVVCQDRFTRHLYRGFPEDHPAVNTSRRFQAVTGAVLWVRREAFEAVGGFDTDFVNAYEDHDLCLRIGERGHEVHYCHESVLHHDEGVSRAGRIEEQERATRLYRLRWAHRLVPDDLRYYADDGLLVAHYDEGAQVRLTVSPRLAVLDGDRAMEADRLLAARAVQVEALRRGAGRAAAPHADGAGGSGTGASPASPAAVATAAADLVPPAALVTLVGGRFRETGEEFRDYFIHLAGLTPDTDVLEVGCGSGRMAVPLTRELSSGTYEGFDVVRDAVEWCQAAITPRFPNFRFRHADVRSGFYNPGAPVRARDYTFPYSDASRDLVLLTSVFTHLLPADMMRYLDEIARVLRPGGRVLATFFMLNEESVRFVRAGLTLGFPFVFAGDGYMTLDPVSPEAAVAYDEAVVRDALASRGLAVEEPIRYGSWCGRPDGLSLQDILVAVKA